MGDTGMETADIIKGIAKQINPSVIIAIDALAARNIERLNTTIQLSDRGINPGSGVGNHRVGINYENTRNTSSCNWSSNSNRCFDNSNRPCKSSYR